MANLAETAYELACMNACDLVLCDYTLPWRRDGIWLCEQLQSDRSTVKRVLMTDEMVDGWERHQQEGLINGLWDEEVMP